MVRYIYSLLSYHSSEVRCFCFDEKLKRSAIKFAIFLEYENTSRRKPTYLSRMFYFRYHASNSFPNGPGHTITLGGKYSAMKWKTMKSTCVFGFSETFHWGNASFSLNCKLLP